MKKIIKNKPPRLLSIDFFRGLTIILMILTSAGSVIPQLEHADWNGWTIADTIFPSFLLIMGVSMVFSFKKRININNTKKNIILHIFKRTIIIFCLGFLPFGRILRFLIGYGLDLSNLRVMGVLQRIAITYFFAGIIFLYFKKKGIIIWITFLLAFYWMLLIFVPVPGYGAGVLEKEGNLVQYIDGALLEGHLGTKTFDPEGLLSTVPAIASVLLGILAGQIIISNKNKIQNTKKLITLGLILIICGQVLNNWFPINKNLWTSSFVIFMAGLAYIIFAISYFIIEVKEIKKWCIPFVYFGMNSITLYFISMYIGREPLSKYAINLFKSIIIKIVPANIVPLLISLSILTMLYILAYIMYKNRIFIKI